MRVSYVRKRRPRVECVQEYRPEVNLLARSKSSSVRYLAERIVELPQISTLGTDQGKLTEYPSLLARRDRVMRPGYHDKKGYLELPARTTTDSV